MNISAAEYLIPVSVHGHGELQVGWDGSRTDGYPILVPDLQVMGNVTGRGQSGGGCQAQQTAHPQPVSQNLRNNGQAALKLIQGVESPHTDCGFKHRAHLLQQLNAADHA